jgi:hypothetical protein
MKIKRMVPERINYSGEGYTGNRTYLGESYSGCYYLARFLVVVSYCYCLLTCSFLSLFFTHA